MSETLQRYTATADGSGNSGYNIFAMLAGAVAGLGVYWYLAGGKERRKEMKTWLQKYGPLVMPMMGGMFGKLTSEEK